MATTYDKVLVQVDGYAYRPVGGSADGVAGAATYLQWTCSEPVALTGGSICAWQGVYGDTVDVEVGAVDGSGAWFTKRTLTRGLPLLVGQRLEIGADYALEVPVGLSVRVTYHSVGANDPQIGANIDSWFPSQSTEAVVVTFSSGPA